MITIEEMRKRIPDHPYLKKILDELMDEGISEDEALSIMVYSWLKGKIKWD